MNLMNCAKRLQKTHFAQQKTFNTHNDLLYMRHNTLIYERLT